MTTIYHSAFGGDLVFETNDSLEHADKNPGTFGRKNTGRDRKTFETRLNNAFDVAKSDAFSQLKKVTMKEYDEAGGDSAVWLKVTYEIPPLNYKSSVFKG